MQSLLGARLLSWVPNSWACQLPLFRQYISWIHASIGSSRAGRLVSLLWSSLRPSLACWHDPPLLSMLVVFLAASQCSVSFAIEFLSWVSCRSRWYSVDLALLRRVLFLLDPLWGLSASRGRWKSLWIQIGCSRPPSLRGLSRKRSRRIGWPSRLTALSTVNWLKCVRNLLI